MKELGYTVLKTDENGNEITWEEFDRKANRFANFLLSRGLKKGDKVQVFGFGNFEVKTREARTGRNPRTKETIQIPATKLPVFKAAKALKDTVAK